MRSTHIFTALTVVLLLLITTNNEALGLKKGDGKMESMPEFTYYTLEGSKFSNKDLQENKTYLFVYFNPMCDLCRTETEEILENIDQLSEVQVLMVTPADLREVKTFVDEYKLADYDQIKILHDPEDRFYLEFGAIGYPNLYIYDNQQEMVAYFDRATEFREIKQALKPVLTKSND